MNKPISSLLAASALVLLTATCKQKPAAAPAQVPQAPPQPTLPAPPPPRPACESMDERCQALPETELEVPESRARFRPPASWTYARETSAAVTVAPDGNAVLAFALAANPEADAMGTTLEQLFTRLQISGVQAAALKARFKKPDSVIPTEGGTLQLWELEKAAPRPLMNGKAGSLLVVHAVFGDQTLVGAGFVVKPAAEAQAAPIMTSVQSLRSPGPQ
ncbi:MAG TPA: hypothetical protein VK524_23640 [Polyangiaceae bacterium]|nr:hypothetical protein [Polyangiaceae bacterium]